MMMFIEVLITTVGAGVVANGIMKLVDLLEQSGGYRNGRNHHGKPCKA